MKTTERQTIKPIGLARFLVAHGECAEGFETTRDRRVITVICRGCDASFSFLTSSPEGVKKDVEAALVELAEASGPEYPADDGSASKPNETPTERKPIHTPPANGSVPAPQGAPRRHRTLPPPGPLAPRHHVGLTPSQRLARSFQRSGRRLVEAIDNRHRSIALAALGLTGAYVLLGLTIGGEPSSSEGTESPGDPQVPVAAQPSIATPAPVTEPAVPTQAFQAGGPEVPASFDAPEFSVALPSDWGHSLGADGRTLFGPIAGGAEVQVIARPRGDLSIAALADGAATSLTQSTPGAQIERLPAQPAGNLLQVARTTTDSAVRTAYIGLGETTAYALIAHLRKDASALVRMQAQGVLGSFEAQP